LLSHTASRILKHQPEVIEKITDDSVKNLILMGKWGLDGSTGQSKYKQKALNNNFDSTLLVTSYVPLQLITNSSDPKGQEMILKIYTLLQTNVDSI